MKKMVYTAQMVPLIMADLKTNSRRIMRVQPPESTVELRKGLLGLWCGFDEKGDETGFEIYSPHQTGDIVYVAEGYRIIEQRYPDSGGMTVAGIYTADGAPFDCRLRPPSWRKFWRRKKPNAKSSSRFMYASLARTWLEILDVKAERIQDISEEDARKEGARIGFRWDSFSGLRFEGLGFHRDERHRAVFHDLWNSIYGPDAWDRDDWVWAYKLKRCEKPEED